MKIATPLFALAAILVLLAGCESPSQVKPPVQTTTANPSSQDAIFDLKDLDQQPKAIKRVPPVYPFDLKRKGVSGYALIEFVVDTSGKPVQFKAVRASHEAFIDATIASLSQWRFKPGIKDGKPCACRMQQPMDYAINER